MQTNEIGIILLIGLLIASLIFTGIPYTTNLFISQSTDANDILFNQGYYDGNLLIVDGNIISFISTADFNGGSGGSITDTNFETAGYGDLNMDLNYLQVPAGANKQIQFNNSGSLGADSNFVWDNTNKRLGIGTTTPANKLSVVGNIASSADITALGNIYNLADNGKHYFGAGQDASIKYDGTNLVINPKEVGSGIIKLSTANFNSTGGDGTNLYIGQDSALTISLPRRNVALGYEAIRTAGNSTDSVAVGYQALRGGGSRNVAVGALTLDGSTGNDHTAIGYNALGSVTTSQQHTAVGSYAGDAVITAGGTTSIGYSAYSRGNGVNATSLGHSAGNRFTGGNYNTFIGAYAGGNSGASATGANNLLAGYYAGYSLNTSGANNVILGYRAGLGAHTGNVLIGYQSGYNETGSNKLYIENSNSATPLIYGEFDNDLVKINGDLYIPSDSKALIFGAGQDASVKYDGTNLIVNPKEVGDGNLIVEGNLNVEGNLVVGGCVVYNGGTLGTCT